VAFSTLLSALAFVFGAFTLRLTQVYPRDENDFSVSLLIGLFILSTLLLALAFISPFQIKANFLLLATIGGILGLGSLENDSRRQGVLRLRSRTSIVSLAALALGFLSATFWSRQSLSPPTIEADIVVFKPWQDYFYHASITAVFSHTRGANSLGSDTFAGMPLDFYHFGSYLLPAAFAAFTPSTAYQAITAFWVPGSILLTGLAAYALARSWYGEGAALSASVCVLLLPDASFYGVANPWFSYYWLQEVAPGGAFGTAMAALACLFMTAGCKQGRWSLVLVSLGIGGILLLFKAQIFVVTTPLLLAWPVLFFKRLPFRWRLAGVLASSVLIALGVTMSKYIKTAPMISLDGSGAKSYLTLVQQNQPANSFASLLARVSPRSSYIEDIYLGLPTLLLGTFGVFSILTFVFLTMRTNDRREPSVTWLPMSTVAIYLILALGMSKGKPGWAGAEELAHRPFVWAYFVVVTWCGGEFYMWLRRMGWLTSIGARVTMAVAVGLLLAFAFSQGSHIHYRVSWGSQLTNARIPRGLVESCQFVRENSAPEEVIQDSKNDPLSLCGALAERRAYLANAHSETLNGALYSQRKTQAGRLKEIRDAGQLQTFVRDTGITWYILHPDDYVAWPSGFLAKPVFSSLGYRVYRFTTVRPDSAGT
jgi:hypothetical protein